MKHEKIICTEGNGRAKISFEMLKKKEIIEKIILNYLNTSPVF